MMKKKYIKPEVKVYEVGTQQLLAGSGVDYHSDDAPSDMNDGML